MASTTWLHLHPEAMSPRNSFLADSAGCGHCTCVYEMGRRCKACHFMFCEQQSVCCSLGTTCSTVPRKPPDLRLKGRPQLGQELLRAQWLEEATTVATSQQTSCCRQIASLWKGPSLGTPGRGGGCQQHLGDPLNPGTCGKVLCVCPFVFWVKGLEFPSDLKGFLESSQKAN